MNENTDKHIAQLEAASERIATLERRVELLRTGNNQLMKKNLEMEARMAQVESYLMQLQKAFPQWQPMSSIPKDVVYQM